MSNDKALSPQVVFTPRPNEDACKNLSECITAILNGIENARNPETINLDINIAIRISRTPKDKNN